MGISCSNVAGFPLLRAGYGPFPDTNDRPPPVVLAIGSKRRPQGSRQEKEGDIRCGYLADRDTYGSAWAADMIRAVVLDLTTKGLEILSGLVAIRTFLSCSVTVELNGHAPWQPAPRRDSG